MKTKISLYFTLTFFIAAFITAQHASAQQLVYEPKNPAFGGNPVNYSWLKLSADTQNLYESERSYDLYQRDPLADFQSSLQRQVLSQLTRDLVRQQFEGEIQESRFEFGEFTIDISPGVDGIEIIIFNILTGDETSIKIPYF